VSYFSGLSTKIRTIAPERWVILLLMLIAGVAIYWAFSVNSAQLRVTMLSVGDGDAIIVQGYNGKTIMIDGGSRGYETVGEDVIVPNLYALDANMPGLSMPGITTIDAIIITHTDDDHVNGLQAVMSSLKVKSIYMPGNKFDGKTGALYNTAIKNNIPILPAVQGQIIPLGNDSNLSILYPQPYEKSKGNTASVVVLLTCDSTSILFTGDLDETGEKQLMKRYPYLHADILKVAHHGADTGTKDAFLNALSPTTALISARGNTDHPHPNTLKRLADRNITIWRTDTDGCIFASSNGKQWKIFGYKGKR
jgi:competence protein ComEC